MFVPAPQRPRLEWEPIHAAAILALVFHVVLLLSAAVFAPAQETERIRVVAPVDVVDSIVRPTPKPPPPMKRPTPPRVAAPAGERPPGKPAARPTPAGRPRRMGPAVPRTVAPRLPGPTTPSHTRSSGAGTKPGLGGLGGSGDGDGTGDGGGGGDGSGGGAPVETPTATPDPLNYLQFTIDDSGLSPLLFEARPGLVELTLHNNSRESRSLKVEGHGAPLYEDHWTAVPAGGQISYQVNLPTGWYTITVPECSFEDGYVARLCVRN